MQRYNPKDIEPKWQKIWEETNVYTTDLDSGKPKYIAMSMFNYPSGAGIHIGHAMNYTISDVKARFKRQQGYESYHPVGWDAFGLPAENYALKTGVSPQESMANIIPGYHKQYKAMGWSNDWEKEIATHLPEYYKWTQWIFTQLYKNGLVYQDARLQWWCPIDKTVLANEQVIDGKCWRHDGPSDPPAEKREIKQWFFKITDYADELLEAIDALDWTDSVKLAQRNWIGKSIGAEIDFKVQDSDKVVKVFTTRPDTLFGATFMVLAPEHELVVQITTDGQKSAVEAYVKAALKKSELERQAEKQKTGVFSGAYAINPVNGEAIPIWIADYVLVGYGTGAIMAVPAHDERDNEFAKKFNLEIRQVIAPYEVYEGVNAPKAGVDTVKKKTVDAVITNKAGKYLLQIEGEQVHFVGGGVDVDDQDEEAALRREVLEETGYVNIASIRKVAPTVSGIQYRHTKQKNQQAFGAFYEVLLENEEKVASEADEGKHQLEWVAKDEVEKHLTWSWHKDGWQHYLSGADPECYYDEGVLIDSGEYNFILSSEAREKIVADLTKLGVAQEKVNYRMNDWSVSRQRYWGAPIPIIYCPKDGALPVPDEDLPVILPEITDFEPTGDGRSALARATDWLKVKCPKCGGEAERETDTLDTYIDSSWYMYRYFDPHNHHAIFNSQLVKKWEPIDFYNGADHATAHLLYARFIGHFFHKLGLVNEPEPFKQFLFNGKVTASDGTMFSKSKGNGVDPLEIIDSGYGADALRTYLMFAAPLDQWVRWDPQGVPGAFRFLSRLWILVQEYLEMSDVDLSDKQQLAVNRAVHPAIKKITEDLEENRYNTAIAAAMACVNELYKLKADQFGKHPVWQSSMESIVALVAPFAPHLADELWQQLGHSQSVHRDSWPTYDEQYLLGDTITVVVQVNGKVRAELQVSPEASEEEILKSAQASDRVKAFTDGKTVRKTIYVPGKLVNLVVG